MTQNIIKRIGRRGCLLIIVILLTSIILPAPAFYAADLTSNTPKSVGNLDWQKTFDRHVLLSAAYGNGVYVAVGEDGVIKSSADGEIWNVVNNGGAALHSVTWGNGRFVAAGSLGTILTSTDGKTWTRVITGTTGDLKTAAWNGSAFIAAGEKVRLFSENGTNWTTRQSEETYTGSVAGSEIFIITMSDSTFDNVYYTKGGLDWSPAKPGDYYGYYNPAFNGDRFILYGRILHQNGYATFVSEDGAVWTEVNKGPDTRSITAGGEGFTAIGDSYRDSNGILTQNVYFSSDGETWQSRQLKWDSGYFSDLKMITWCHDRYIGFNHYGEILTSPDGLQWNREKSSLGYQYEGNHITWDGSQFVAYAQGGSMMTSQDGTTWTESPARINLDQPIHNIFYFGDSTILAIAGDPARLFVSKDGTNWISHDFADLQYAGAFKAGNRYLLDTGKELYLSSDAISWEKLVTGSQSLSARGIAYDGKTYVSVGGRGIIYGGEGNHSEPFRVIGTSKDLKTWDIVRTDQAASLKSVVQAGGQFVAVGDSGTILTSKDGLYWKQQTSNTANDLNEVIWDGTRYIAVGAKGAIIYSTDGVVWEKEKAATGSDLYRIIPDGDQYFALGWNTILKGKPDRTVQQDRFLDIGTHWAKPYINELSDRKLINGVDGKNFAPDRPISRAEFAAITARALHLDLTRDGSFADSKPGDWHYPYISAAYDQGILRGYGSAGAEAVIKPDKEITREEAMAMTDRALTLKRGRGVELSAADKTAALAAFADRGSLSAWARDSAAVCIWIGIINGDNGLIKPSASITRAETAAVVLRMLDYFENDDIKHK